MTEDGFIELFNAWILSVCDSSVVLGHTIPDVIREKVRPNYVGYGIDKDKKFSTAIRGIMGWEDKDLTASTWGRILRETFMDEGQSSNGKSFYVGKTFCQQHYLCQRFVSQIRKTLCGKDDS